MAPLLESRLLLGSLLLFITCVVVAFDWKYQALRDDSTLDAKSPYSFARVQMSWWTIFIFSALGAVAIFTRQLPNPDPSLIYMLGLSVGTGGFSKMIDVKAKQAESSIESCGFFADILNKGDLHRLQALLANVIVGAWFILQVFHNLTLPLTATFTVDMIMPAIPQYILVLLSVSSALYLGCKVQES